MVISNGEEVTERLLERYLESDNIRIKEIMTYINAVYNRKKYVAHIEEKNLDYNEFNLDITPDNEESFTLCYTTAYCYCECTCHN